MTVADAGGRGGRNQELALAAALAAPFACRGAIASLGTDGSDNGPLAGALVDEATVPSSAVDVASAHLARNDSTSFFEAHAPTSLLVSGPTGTNVADLMLALGDKRN